MCNYPDGACRSGYLTVYLLVYNAVREKQRYRIASATHYNAEAVEFDMSSFTQTDFYLVFLFLVRHHHCHLHILYSIVFNGFWNPHFGGREGRRGSAMTPLERAMVVSYRLSIVTVALLMVLCLCFSFKATRKCFITWVDVRQPPVSIVILF